MSPERVDETLFRMEHVLRCLRCGALLDASWNTNTTDPPQAGHLVVCLKCVAVMRYEAGCLAVTLLTDEQVAELPSDAQLQLRRVRAVLLRRLRDRKSTEFIHASGQCICTSCGKDYFGHPKDKQYEFLHRLCDGTRVKL